VFSQIGQQVRVERVQVLLAFVERAQVPGVGAFGAERLALAVRLDRPVIFAAAQMPEFTAEPAEELLQRQTGSACICPQVAMPSCSSRPAATRPTPQMRRTGSSRMNAGTSSGATSSWPSGLFQSLAIFAMSLFGPIPAEAVSPVVR
jgi:hypothetical protein